MTTRTYSTVVFDFGGVLITPITNQMADVASWHDVSMLDMLDVLMGPRDTSTSDHPWHRAERGELPTAAMQDAVVPWALRAGIDLRGDEYDRLLLGDFVVIDAALDHIRRLRAAGIRTGLLTNSFVEFRPTLEERVDFSLFDVVVDSSEVGCRKPEPEIYALTAQRIGVPAAEIVYLDDFLANIEGARLAGWQTIHVTDPLAALDELDALLAD
jgi:epoxide hydrolase-like predicted phosphatase